VTGLASESYLSYGYEVLKVRYVLPTFAPDLDHPAIRLSRGTCSDRGVVLMERWLSLRGMTNRTKLTLNIPVTTLASPIESTSFTGYDRLVTATFAHHIGASHKPTRNYYNNNTKQYIPSTPSNAKSAIATATIEFFLVGTERAPPSTSVGTPTNATGAAKIASNSTANPNDPKPA
jgi:hypothetical protein